MALDRMEGSSDRGDEENVSSSSSSSAAAAFGVAASTVVETMSIACKRKCIVLYERRHDDFEVCSVTGPPERGLVWKLRRQKGSRTICVALVLCLGRHSDPPEVMKTLTCARMECWIDPFSVAPGKALELIGKALHTQYKRWQPDASYELLLDPTVDAVKKLCTSCRNFTKSERILFHFNGHGVPEPTANGEIRLFNKSYTRYILLPVRDLDSWLKTPSMYVFDCSFAGRIVDAFIEHQDGNSAASSSTRDCILLAACGAYETLPQSDKFPADLFTSCLTTPIKMALRWLRSHSLHCDEINDTLIDKIPGSRKDRKTLLGELHCIFTAITDAIAWDVLPHDLFRRLFRQDILLAERIMRPLNCSPVSFPVLPSTNQHHMWDAWDMAAEICLSQLPSLIDDPNAKFQPSPFFMDQLTAFESWLDHGSEHKKPPAQLPIVINTVLSHYHRNRALWLLGRFFDMGPWAVDLALSLGIYAYLLKLLQTTERDIQPLLVFLWAKILALDKSCQADLVKDGGSKFFIKFLDSTDACTEKRAMAAFVLAVIVDRHHVGLGACIQADLIPVCLRRLQLANPHDAKAEPLLCQWLCLCLGKLWEDFPEAQMIGLQADAPGTFASLLSKSQPEVRAAAVFALGMLLDVGNDSLRDETGVDDECDDDEKTKAELIIVKSLLEVVADGSPMVRAEVVVALARFAFVHNKHLKPIAAAYWKPKPNRLCTSLPSLPNIKISNYGYRSVGQYTHSGSPVLRIGSDCTSSGLRGRVSMSSPLASTGIMCGSPQSNDSSQHSDSGELLKDHASSGDTNFSRSKPLDNTVYTQCVLAMCTLAKDPSPRIANLGQRMLSMIGIKQVVTKALQPDGPIQPGDSPATSPAPSLHGPARSPSSWDTTAGHSLLTFKTPPVSPPRQSLTGMRRVSSLEFSPLWMNSPNLGLADPIFGFGGSGSECSLLPQSTIYYWSCDHFSRSPVTAADDEEEIFAKREVRERYAIDRIAKCQQYSVNKFSTEIASWDTKFETGTKVALLHPFDPIVVAADKDERIRVWNYDKGTFLNSFNNHEVSDKGISKLCLVNELDDSLLLVASCNGNIRIWKNYSIKSKQKLVTAFSSIQDHEHGIPIVNAVVDWQQQSGYLYASGDISSIRLWDLEKEQRVFSLSSLSESRISALSASQVHGHLIAAGFVDGSVRIFDIRTPDIPVCITRPHNQIVERVVGVGFQPALGPSKIVSASQAGDIRFLDIRSESKTYLTIDAHRGSLTALAIHRHAPVIASGSAKKIVKVFSLQGGQPSVTIQKTGPVSCLTFHPYRVQLAVGADDAHVSFVSDGTPHSR